MVTSCQPLRPCFVHMCGSSDSPSTSTGTGQLSTSASRHSRTDPHMVLSRSSIMPTMCWLMNPINSSRLKTRSLTRSHMRAGFRAPGGIRGRSGSVPYALGPGISGLLERGFRRHREVVGSSSGQPPQASPLSHTSGPAEPGPQFLIERRPGQVADHAGLGEAVLALDALDCRLGPRAELAILRHA